MNASTYRSGALKGLPKFCECGGRMLYELCFGRVFAACDTCTPVVTVNLPRTTKATPPEGA